MVKPNITGLSLTQYLKMRMEQLSARRISIEVYNKNYLPAWGNKHYTEEDLKQLEEDEKECAFLSNALEEYKAGNLIKYIL